MAGKEEGMSLFFFSLFLDLSFEGRTETEGVRQRDDKEVLVDVGEGGGRSHPSRSVRLR